MNRDAGTEELKRNEESLALRGVVECRKVYESKGGSYPLSFSDS